MSRVQHMTGWWLGLVCGMLALQSVYAAETEGRDVAADTGPTAEEILTREPDAEDYGSEERCIMMRRIRRTEVLDEKHIAIHMGRDEYMIIQFQHRCPGLRPRRPVIFEPSISNRFCALDSIRPTFDSGLGGIEPGPRCSVPGFQKVTKEQVVMLKDALKIKARQEREERKASRQAEREAKRQERALKKAADAADKAADKET